MLHHTLIHEIMFTLFDNKNSAGPLFRVALALVLARSDQITALLLTKDTLILEMINSQILKYAVQYYKKTKNK